MKRLWLLVFMLFVSASSVMFGQSDGEVAMQIVNKIDDFYKARFDELLFYFRVFTVVVIALTIILVIFIAFVLPAFRENKDKSMIKKYQKEYIIYKNQMKAFEDEIHSYRDEIEELKEELAKTNTSYKSKEKTLDLYIASQYNEKGSEYIESKSYIKAFNYLAYSFVMKLKHKELKAVPQIGKNLILCLNNLNKKDIKYIKANYDSVLKMLKSAKISEIRNIAGYTKEFIIVYNKSIKRD